MRITIDKNEMDTQSLVYYLKHVADAVEGGFLGGEGWDIYEDDEKS